MRRAAIAALLFAAYAYVAPPRLSAGQLRASLPGGNLLRIADGRQLLAPTANICLVTDPSRPIMDAAETLANRMFASIGVRLEWHEPTFCPAGGSDPVFLTIQNDTPEKHFPGALGIALPGKASHAWVFYDRVRQSYRGDKYVAALLAHVMAHEIAHVLQGINRHSESGILKAHWSDFDCAQMASRPLLFTREDATLIHRGLEERRARPVSTPTY